MQVKCVVEKAIYVVSYPTNKATRNLLNFWQMQKEVLFSLNATLIDIFARNLFVFTAYILIGPSRGGALTGHAHTGALFTATLIVT